MHTNQGPIFKEPKSAQSTRTIDITEDLVEVLRTRKQKKTENKEFFGSEYNDKHNLVFAKENGEYLYPKTSYRRVKRVLKKSELEEFNIKSFRHTHATFMLQNNIHPRIVQERLGHSSIEITLNIYSHVIPSMQKEATEKLQDFLND